eukprot:1177037-Amphidinium_carterae.1
MDESKTLTSELSRHGCLSMNAYSVYGLARETKQSDPTSKSLNVASNPQVPAPLIKAASRSTRQQPWIGCRR